MIRIKTLYKYIRNAVRITRCVYDIETSTNMADAVKMYDHFYSTTLQRLGYILYDQAIPAVDKEVEHVLA